MARINLDHLDLTILQMLANNARKPYLEIARECGVSGAAVHQRIQKLTNMGVIKGSESHIDPSAVGYDTCAYMGFFLKDPSQFNHVVDELKRIPEVVECHFTIRSIRYIHQVVCPQQRSSAPYNSRTTAIARTGKDPESLISFKEVFRRQLPILERND